MYRGRIKKIHFIGIGGSGMSGIAEVLLNMGYEVSGSDLASTDTTERLRALGAVIHTGHDKEHVRDSDCVVYSSAVKRDNPEMREAASLKIPAIPRAEMLAELMRMKYGIAIAGTHGKTTVTSMVAAVLAHAGIDPTIVTGGRLNSIGANAKLGTGKYLVAEADESDGSFLKLSPVIAVVTNIDREHMDHYSDMEQVKRAYLDFMNKVPFYGCCIFCLDHPAIQALVPSISRRFISYGLSAQADVRAAKIKQKGMHTSFEIKTAAGRLGTVNLAMPGEHNVMNSLAAVSVALELGIGFEDIKRGLEEFAGVERRFQVKGVVGDVMVVDDYGHHPVEIRAVLEAVKRGWSRPTVVVFQPHRYTRTRDLFDDFLSAFNDATKLILTDIYPAGEEPIEGVTGRKLFGAVKKHGHKNVTYIEDLDRVPLYLKKTVQPGDIVITLGAGNVWRAGEQFLELSARTEKENAF